MVKYTIDLIYLIWEFSYDWYNINNNSHKYPFSAYKRFFLFELRNLSHNIMASWSQQKNKVKQQNYIIKKNCNHQLCCIWLLIDWHSWWISWWISWDLFCKITKPKLLRTVRILKYAIYPFLDVNSTLNEIIEKKNCIT